MYDFAKGKMKSSLLSQKTLRFERRKVAKMASRNQGSFYVQSKRCKITEQDAKERRSNRVLEAGVMLLHTVFLV